MARIAAVDIEKRWYDVWSGWDKSDREVAMRVLAQLNPRLPVRPKHHEDCVCVDCKPRTVVAGRPDVRFGEHDSATVPEETKQVTLEGVQPK